jgi:hypothetical protein
VKDGEAHRAEVHLELLLSRVVRAANGRRVGRLEEVRAEKRGTGWVVTEYHLGAAALMERLSANALGLFRSGRLRRGYVARWDQLDVSDPENMRLTCPIEELRRIEGGR